MTPHIDAVGLLPEFTLTALIALVFVLDLFTSDARKSWVAGASVFAMLVPLACVVGLGLDHRHASMLNGGYRVDDFALLTKGLFLACGALVFLLGQPSKWRGEYCILILCSVLGMVMVASARELLIFFVAFELLAVPGYMLVGWEKRSTHGHEAALKYYLLGVVATAVTLYGISLLFGLAGSTLFSDVSRTLANGGQDIALARLAILFVIVGMAFKVSAVPMHFWAPDVYQGAPLPVAAFLSVASKAGGLVALMELLVVAMPDATSVWAPMVWGLAAVTMTVGNLAALRQTDVVRMLAYSSIAQAGYLLIPLAVAGHYGGGVDSAVVALLQSLIIYAVTNIGAFAVVVAVSRRTKSSSIAAYKGLFVTSPALAVIFTAMLLSLAGIPPLGGWYAKLVVLRAAIEAGTPAAITLVAVAAVNTAIGLVYYAVVIRQMWLDAPEVVEPNAEAVADEPRTATIPSALSLSLGLTTVGVVVAGVLPGVVAHLGGLASFIK